MPLDTTNPLTAQALVATEQLLKRRIAPSTAAEYRRIGERYADASLEAIHELHKPTRRVVIAAIKRRLARELRTAQLGDDAAAIAELAQQWHTLAKLFPAPQANPLLAAFERQQRQGDPKGGKAVRTRSKKILLSRLPRDWRERVLRRLASIRSPHTAAVAVLDATGARPEELRQGVRVRLTSEGQIECALKLAKGRGTSHTRTLRIDPANSLGAQLLMRALQRTQQPELTVIAPSKMALTNALRRAGRVLFDRQDLTAYAYRHQFAADQKRSGAARLEIAAAMGHADDRMLSRYGATSQGVSNRRITAETTREPRAEHARQFARVLNQSRSRSR